MTKRILITGATDGIGLATAKSLISLGHHVLLHGRNESKLESVAQSLKSISGSNKLETYVADLALMSQVKSLATTVADRHETIDVLINNAGVFMLPNPVTAQGLDLRFVVNTIAPYLLTQQLMPMLNSAGRVVNLSSAAQAPVNIDALYGRRRLDDNQAYAQSKLALTMWSRDLALSLRDQGPAIIAVNPGSFLGSKMVKEAYGSEGKDLSIGADILTRAASDDEFKTASGKYFDNDSGRFTSPHPDALAHEKTAKIVEAVETILEEIF